MDGLKVSIVDKKTHALLETFYVSNYVLSNDILDPSTSSFELAITNSQSIALMGSDIMSVGNFVFAEAPTSILNKSVSALYLGIISSFTKKTLVTEHFYTLFDIDIPIQTTEKQSSFKYRMSFEWLNLCVLNVLYKTVKKKKDYTPEFLYNSKYEPKKQSNGHNYNDNGDPVILIDSVPGLESDVDHTDRFATEEGYTTEEYDTSTFNTENLLSKLKEGVGLYHYSVNPTINYNDYTNEVFRRDSSEEIFSTKELRPYDSYTEEDYIPDTSKFYDRKIDINFWYGQFVGYDKIAETVTPLTGVSSIMNRVRVSEKEVFTQLKFSDQCSFIKKVDVNDSTKNYNAVFFYNDQPTTVTIDRIYITNNNEIIQVPGTGSAADLDIPNNVSVPLSIKHYKLKKDVTYTDEDRANLAKDELSETNDGELEINIDVYYRNSPYNPLDLRPGMWANIFANGVYYTEIMLTGIEIDTSKEYYSLSFGAKRTNIYSIVQQYNKKGQLKIS